ELGQAVANRVIDTPGATAAASDDDDWPGRLETEPGSGFKLLDRANLRTNRVASLDDRGCWQHRLRSARGHGDQVDETAEHAHGPARLDVGKVDRGGQAEEPSSKDNGGTNVAAGCEDDALALAQEGKRLA